MRKLFYLMLVVLGTAALVACSKDDDNNNGGGNGNDKPIQTPVYHYGEITMINDAHRYYENKISLTINTFNVGDTITIDYGDGYVHQAVAESDEEYYNEGNLIKRGEIDLGYTYSDKEERTITIKGNISGLSCNESRLTSLDVSNCTALGYLDCSSNDLTSLDVSKNIALTDLDCGYNQLTSLDVSKNTALDYLDCGGNQLTSLDVTKNTALTELDCFINQLTSLDVSGCTALTRLYCYDNQFTAEEMNKIYEALPTVESGDLHCDQLGNPGIAEQKGWNVIRY